MTTRPSAELRRQVIARVQQCCAYCLAPQELAASTHQVDHVIAEQHGGHTVPCAAGATVTSADNDAVQCPAV